MHQLRCFSPLTGILVRRRRRLAPRKIWIASVSVPLRGFWYADHHIGEDKSDAPRSLSPLTGILVRRLCLSVPAPRLGSQAIFSNLRLFWPFSLTRVKNKIEAVSFIRLVMPFIAGLKIFKPTGFLALKSVFQRSVVL